MGREEPRPMLRKSEVAPLEDDDASCVELKRVGSMAAPMVAANMCQYLLQVVSLMMVGHLGLLVSFFGVVIATFFVEVTSLCSCKVFFHTFFSSMRLPIFALVHFVD